MKKCLKCEFPCEHHWSLSSYSTKVADFRCWRCGGRTERKLTPYEAKLVHKRWGDFTQPKPENDIHFLWHDFLRNFKEGGAWKYKGYDLIERVAKWAFKHPEVRTVRVDDAAHANSDLVFVPHQSKRKVMGISVVFIPQCTGEDPIRFFLYPSGFSRLFMTLHAFMPMMMQPPEPPDEHVVGLTVKPNYGRKRKK